MSYTVSVYVAFRLEETADARMSDRICGETVMFGKKKNKNTGEQNVNSFYESDEEATVFVNRYEDEEKTSFFWETNEREYVVRLTDVMNPEKTFTMKVNDSVVIGHSAALSDVYIDHDRAISRKHCRLVRHGNEYFLQDMDSSNGTYVNGSRIYREEKAIYDGDLIRMGRVELKFETVHG